MRLLQLFLTGSLVWSQTPVKNVLERFPESEDKETVTSTCSACHTLARVAANNRDKAQWAQTIKAHDSRGLKLEPDETAVIVRYLSTYFGPKVYVNTATSDQLASLPHFDDQLAEKVIRYRKEYGPFQDVDQVIKLIGAETFAQVKNRLVTGTSEK